jgi:type IV pilus assembly protein PilA
MDRSSRRRGGRSPGFSLIEIMFVVAIVGVLVSVAIPLFLNYQLRSKSAEAKTNLGVIKVLEQARFSERGAYISVAPEPPVIPGRSAVAFNAAGGFFPLGFEPEGQVYFSYGVAVTDDGVGFTTDAAADIDGDGFPQIWGFTKPGGGGGRAPGRSGCNAGGLHAEQVGPCNPSHGRSVF